MDSITIIIIFSISTILSVFGYYKQKKRLFLFLPIAAGILIMITGLTLFNNPLQHETGNTATINETNINITYEYENINANTNLVLAWTLLLAGLSNILITSIMLYDTRFEEETIEEI